MKEGRRKIFTWLIVFLVLIFLFANRGFRDLYRGYFYLKKLEKELTKLKKENQEHRRELYSLETDLSAIEKIARAKLNLVKPGETIYRFLPRGKE